jgi:AraC-like DNA-binding protein
MILQQTDHFTQHVYPYKAPCPEDADFFLQMLGSFESKGNFVWEQIAPGISLHAVTAGSGTVICDGCPCPAKAGDLFVFRKGSRYRYYDEPSKPWKYIYIALAGSKADRCMDLAGFSGERPVRPLTPLHPFWAGLHRLHQEFQQNRTSGVAPVSAAWELFELLIRPNVTNSNKENPVDTARHLIESSPQALTNVNDLASALNISRVTLFRCFRDRYGISVKEFMEQIRFERIEPLLKQSARPIQEIARIAGFSDPLYFSRAFRKRYGMPPAEWRAQHQR